MTRALPRPQRRPRSSGDDRPVRDARLDRSNKTGLLVDAFAERVGRAWKAYCHATRQPDLRVIPSPTDRLVRFTLDPRPAGGALAAAAQDQFRALLSERVVAPPDRIVSRWSGLTIRLARVEAWPLAASSIAEVVAEARRIEAVDLGRPRLTLVSEDSSL